ncbi:T-cell immunoglobulin and mucin domain-containing protein 4, partial [Tyto alba]
HTASEAVVRGVMGKSVQLSCFYRVAQPNDITDMCWGRGPCPNSKCNKKILQTTGNKVTFRTSQRYNLQGNISYGDVSLTIGKVKAEDAGIYCCRIEIPGWFNDIKKNVKLEVVRDTVVLLTTTVPKATTATTNQARRDTAALLTTTVPPATTATTASSTVITLETTAPPTFAVTENYTFPATIVTTSALPDFSAGFQADDMRTEDDDVFCPAESVTLPGVTTEFPSILPTAEGTKSAHTSLMVEDVPTAATTLPVPTILQTPKKTHAPSELLACVNRSEVNTLLKPFQFFSSFFQFPSYPILIVCLIVVPVILILMVSLFWKRKHAKKFIIKSLGPAEDLEKVFSGAEGENSVFSL